MLTCLWIELQPLSDAHVAQLAGWGQCAVEQRDLVASPHLAISTLDANFWISPYCFEHSLRCSVQQLMQALRCVYRLLAALALLAILGQMHGPGGVLVHR